MRQQHNPLQAVLDRQVSMVEPVVPEPASEPPPEPRRFHRPVRDGRRFTGGQFEPKALKHMKLLAVEEDTTTQRLLEEAIDLLFLKKGRGRIIGN